MKDADFDEVAKGVATGVDEGLIEVLAEAEEVRAWVALLGTEGGVGGERTGEEKKKR